MTKKKRPCKFLWCKDEEARRLVGGLYGGVEMGTGRWITRHVDGGDSVVGMGAWLARGRGWFWSDISSFCRDNDKIAMTAHRNI